MHVVLLRIVMGHAVNKLKKKYRWAPPSKGLLYTFPEDAVRSDVSCCAILQRYHLALIREFSHPSRSLNG